MAPGTTSEFTYPYPVPGMTAEGFLALSMQAIDALGWQIELHDENGLTALTGEDPYYPQAQIRISLMEGAAILGSSLLQTDIYDRDWNREHIARLLSALHRLSQAQRADTNDIAEDWFDARARDQAQLFPRSAPPLEDDKADILAVFKPRGTYFVTPILLNINLLVFIAMAISGVHWLEPDGPSLIRWGANFGPLTLSGEWWRLLSNCFLHIGILHLGMNMYALVFIGLLLEPHLGRLRFITAYLITGLLASVTSLWWHSIPSISAGASGAIFGMYGVFLALLTTNLIEKRMRKIQLMSIAIFVGYNLVAGLKGNTDNAAHIGGLVSGIVLGYMILPWLKSQQISEESR